MKCFACAATLPDDALFCSACGTDLARRDQAQTTEDLEVMLAAANLLRVRQRYAEAEKRCIEVLRADPNNVHAHSLLGDIYRDQGRLDDAREWYRMALDLDPRSRADREKLAEIERRRAGSDRYSEDGSPPSLASPVVVRWLAVVLAVCFLGAVGAIITYRQRRPLPRSHRTEAVTTAQHGPHGEARPVVTPNAGSRTSALPGEAMTDAARDAAGVAEPEEDLLEREAHLEQLIAQQNPWQGEQVSAAVVLTLDGRNALLLIHGVLAGRAPTPDTIAQRTLQTVRLLYQGDPSLQTVDVVIRAAGDQIPYHTLLRARAMRDTVAAIASATTGDEARRAFVVWRWSPAWPDAVRTDATAE